MVRLTSQAPARKNASNRLGCGRPRKMITTASSAG
jgi:hypothetical protein